MQHDDAECRATAEQLSKITARLGEIVPGYVRPWSNVEAVDTMLADLAHALGIPGERSWPVLLARARSLRHRPSGAGNRPE